MIQGVQVGVILETYLEGHHYVKSVRIWSYSGPHSARMRENTDQNTYDYGPFLQTVIVAVRKN